MKPRIRLCYRVWICRSLVTRVAFGREYFQLVLGHGYTPAEAYADWKAQQ